MTSWQSLCILGFILAPFTTSASSSCDASNDFGDTCSISCPEGEAAQCTDGGESRQPECECEEDPSSSDEDIHTSRVLLYPYKESSLMDSLEYKTASSSDSSDLDIRLETETNIEEIINAKLNGLKNYYLRDQCYEKVVGRKCEYEPIPCIVSSVDLNYEFGLAFDCPPVSHKSCYDVKENVCKKISGKLELGQGIKVQGEPEVQVTKDRIKAIPQAAMVMTTKFTNCSTEKQSYTFKHDEETRTGILYSNTDTLKSKQGLSISANVGINVGFIKGGISVSRSESKEVQASKRSDESEYLTKTFSFAEPVKVSELTKSISEHSFLKQFAEAPYEGTVVVDGPIKSNKSGINKLSDVFPEEKDRTFRFKGILRVEYMAENHISVLTHKLSEDECRGKFLEREDIPSVITGNQL
ncbi:hypothetical protein L4174_023740 (plasmid) [Photobacterium sp. CCB-ST2H9]|uniref:hypothetical protein n=1 Tax=Photobacterium sp. CCB-ST2H9 TaxID=2912855 RepID=UPI002003486E|nr:hypothetical protein [Photobacterium sp. CCB-ST2H9]UTM60481.1 hypothetical protein L4174_023740 [Photobacterium sp. CCB-ST2H9]